MPKDNVRKITDEPEYEGLILDLTEDAQAAEGEEITLPCGLGVVLAPANTQKATRASKNAVRKFGGRKAKDLNDLKGQRFVDALVWIMATANFLGFFDPKTKRPEFAARIRETGEVRKFKGNSLENRQRILADFPLIRDQIQDALDLLTEEQQGDLEEASGN